jgi:UDP-glucose 6-dehydrogenase
MNPEFLIEGTAVADFSHPVRSVLGGIDSRTHDVLRELYSSFDADVQRVVTNPTAVETIKYASNAVLATMISFSNEIARLCTAVGGVNAESPAFLIIRRLKAQGPRLTAYDPVARPNEHEDLAGVNLVGSLREAVVDAKIVVLVTRWAEFSQLAGSLNELGQHPLVVDGRGVVDPGSFAHYEGIGR